MPLRADRCGTSRISEHASVLALEGSQPAISSPPPRAVAVMSGGRGTSADIEGDEDVSGNMGTQFPHQTRRCSHSATSAPACIEAFHSKKNPCSKHLRPSERMLGQPFMTSASADVNDRTRTFKRFEATTSPFALLGRIGISISSMLFLSILPDDVVARSVVDNPTTRPQRCGRRIQGRGSMRHERIFRNAACKGIRNDLLRQFPARSYSAKVIPNIDGLPYCSLFHLPFGFGTGRCRLTDAGLETPWYDAATKRTLWNPTELACIARMTRCSVNSIPNRAAPGRFLFEAFE